MGCPDWPKCFGLLAPPTCSCELPPDYQQVFLEKRIAKVERFASMLIKFGFEEKATELRNNKAILVPEEFNAAKAWTEYINRIFGVIAGLLALVFAVWAVFGKYRRRVKWLAIAGLIMLVINAWLGSIVVATNLLPGIVTTHFMLSFLCVFFFMLAMHSERPFQFKGNSGYAKRYWWLLFILILAEVLLGALARENVEWLSETRNLVATDGMMNYKGMDAEFTVHRLMPGIILLLSLFLFWIQRKSNRTEAMAFGSFALLSLLQIAFGAVNIVYVLPPASQVLHILFGSLMPVTAFYFILARRTAGNT